MFYANLADICQAEKTYFRGHVEFLLIPNLHLYQND